MLLKSLFHQLFCLKFSFKLVTFSKSYARKQEWMFFLNTVYVIFDWMDSHTLCAKKVSHLMSDNNFGKCGQIFKILSPGDS